MSVKVTYQQNSGFTTIKTVFWLFITIFRHCGRWKNVGGMQLDIEVLLILPLQNLVVWGYRRISHGWRIFLNTSLYYLAWPYDLFWFCTTSPKILGVSLVSKVCLISRECFKLLIPSKSQLHTASMPTGVRGLTGFRSTPVCWFHNSYLSNQKFDLFAK